MQRPITWPLLAIICLSLAFISVNASCTKNQRTSTIHASLVAVNTAGDEFAVWDLEHQRKMLADAKAAGETREQIVAKLEAYWEKQRKVQHGFELVYKALALAATQTDGPSLQAALSAAKDLVESVQKIMSGQDGPKVDPPDVTTETPPTKGP